LGRGKRGDRCIWKYFAYEILPKVYMPFMYLLNEYILHMRMYLYTSSVTSESKPFKCDMSTGRQESLWQMGTETNAHL